MFDFDLDLDLGSRRRQTSWAVELAEHEMHPQKHKKHRKHRCRERKAKRAAAAQSSKPQPIPMQLPDVTPAQAKYHKEFRDSSVVCLSTEIETGNVEYKLKLSGCISNPNRRHQLITQMRFRLSEGGGECFYYVGVEDDGYPRGLDPKELACSISILGSMAASLAATARLVEYVRGGFGSMAALLHIKANAEEDMRATDLRVAVAGSMDSGKSTLVAVLTHGSDGRPLLDNCRGSARMAVFRHKHEIESGRTSSISHQVLGYDDEGWVINYVGVSAPTPADITAAAARVLNFIDMGGHEKYLKTTLYGMTCMLPDYVLLCVDAASGVTRTTREHLAVAVALEVPTALVITKADAVDARQLQLVLEQLQQLMAPVLTSHQQQLSQGQPQLGIAQGLDGQQWRQDGAVGQEQVEPEQQRGLTREGSHVLPAVDAAGGRAGAGTSAVFPGVPVVLTEAQAASLAAALSELHSCTAAAASFQQVTYPVFTVSCVSGAGLSLLHAFLSRLQPVSAHRSHRQCGSNAGSPAAAVGGSSSSSTSQAAPAKSARDTDQQQEEQQQQQQQQQQQHTSQVLCMERSSKLWLPEQQDVAAGNGSKGAAVLEASAAAIAAPETVAVAAAAADVASGGSGTVSLPAGHFQVVHTYDVAGVGWVVSGIAVSGTIEVGQSLLWGPTPEGGFTPVSVSCIQRSHVPVRCVQPGQTATLALQPSGPGVPASSSKEALLSAAAAAQAAAEEAAAREAAAACAAAAPTIALGKPYVPPVPFAADNDSSTAEAAAVPGVGGCSLDDDQFDMLADDLAAELALDDDEADEEAAAGVTSDMDSFDVVFGDAESTSRATSSIAAAAAPGSGVVSLDHLALEEACGAPSSCSKDWQGGGAGSCTTASSSSSSTSSSSSLGLSSWVLECGGLEAAAAPAAGLECNWHHDAPSLGGSSCDVVGMSRLAAASPSAASLSSMQGRAASPSSAAAMQGQHQASTGDATDAEDAACCIQPAASRPIPPAAGGRSAGGHGIAVGAGCAAAAAAAGCSSSLSVPLGCSPSNWRSKGAVLLDTAAAPNTYWEFEALLVLLGGHWPARGLLTGCWPPAEAPSAGAQGAEEAAAVGSAMLAAAAGAARTPAGAGSEAVPAAAGAAEAGETPAEKQAGAAAAVAAGQRRRPVKQRSKRYDYAYVIHCNSIRQIARVVHMKELREQQQEQADTPAAAAAGAAAAGVGEAGLVSMDSVGSSSSSSDGSLASASNGNQRQQQQQQPSKPPMQHWGLSASIQAAAALLQGQQHWDAAGCGADSGSSSSGGSRRARSASDLGTVVAVRFRFTHRPEWMQVGARMIVRDRSDGHVAAAGFVTQLRDAHKQQQQQHAGDAVAGVGPTGAC